MTVTDLCVCGSCFHDDVSEVRDSSTMTDLCACGSCLYDVSGISNCSHQDHRVMDSSTITDVDSSTVRRISTAKSGLSGSMAVADVDSSTVRHISTAKSGVISTRGILAGGAITTGAVLLAAPVAVPAIAAGLGFTGSGIAAGSWAAGFMASYGGTVAATSTCAVLQSIGATGTFAGAGLTAASGAGISATGVVLAGAGSSIVHGAGVAGNYAYTGLKSLPGAIGSAGATGGRVISGAAVGVANIVSTSAGAVYGAARSLIGKL